MMMDKIKKQKKNKRIGKLERERNLKIVAKEVSFVSSA